MTRAIEEARKKISEIAASYGEHQFAREVIAGCWDHRSDVQAALAGKPLKPKRAA